MMDKGASNILFAVDSNQRVLGTVSDGDIRRYILKTGGLDGVVENIYNRKFIFAHQDTPLEEIKKLMVQFGFLTEEPVFQDFKLEDNTIIQAEKLEVGNSIFKISQHKNTYLILRLTEWLSGSDGTARLFHNYAPFLAKRACARAA